MGWFGDGLGDGLGGGAVVVWAMVCDGLGDGLGGCVVCLWQTDFSMHSHCSLAEGQPS